MLSSSCADRPENWKPSSSHLPERPPASTRSTSSATEDEALFNLNCPKVRWNCARTTAFQSARSPSHRRNFGRSTLSSYAPTGRRFMAITSQQFKQANAREGRPSRPGHRARHRHATTANPEISSSRYPPASAFSSPRSTHRASKQDKTPAQLSEIEISPSGFGLHFPKLDVDLYVPNNSGAGSPWLAKMDGLPPGRSRRLLPKQAQGRSRPRQRRSRRPPAKTRRKIGRPSSLISAMIAFRPK